MTYLLIEDYSAGEARVVNVDREEWRYQDYTGPHGSVVLELVASEPVEAIETFLEGYRAALVANDPDAIERCHKTVDEQFEQFKIKT